MNKLLKALLFAAIAATGCAQVPTPGTPTTSVLKTSPGNVVSNGPIHIGSGNTLYIDSGGELYLASGASLGNSFPWSVLTAIPSPAIVATGDATGNGTLSASGAGSLPLTLAASGVTAGTYGSATVSPSFTINAKGLVTAVTNNTITPGGIGALVPANNLSDVASASTSRTNLGLAIGTNVEAWSSVLDGFTSAGNVPSYYLNAANLTGNLSNARLPAFTGDATSSAGTSALTLAASGATPGTYGDASHVGTVTVNAKGLVTSASSTAISITQPWANISSIPSSVWTLTGDVTGTITTTNLASASGSMTLAASGATAGTYGSATQSLTATVDAKGRVTGVSANTVTPAWANITSNPFTVASGKTVVFSNTLTFAGTDSSTLNVGTGGTLGTAAYTAATAYQAVNTQLTNFAGLGNPGTSGYVLSSTTGGTLSWVAQSGGGGSGTVTSVAAGTGLTGGTITTSGTIGLSSAYAGNGIGTVNGLAWGNGSGTIGTVTLGSGGLSFSGGALSLASTLPSGVQANITAFGAATGTSLDGTPIGFTTPSTGAFTTLQASSTLGVTGAATLASTALVKGVLTVNLNGISAPGLTGLIGSLMAEFSPTNSNAAWVVEDSYGNIPLMALRRMDGTNGSPTPIQSGDFLGEFAIAPYDSLSTSYALSAAIIGTAAETWNGGHGTNLVFRTTQIGNPGAPSSRMELFASGGLALGSGILGTDPGAGNLSVAGTGLFAGVLSVSNTTAATSTTTGAITSAGGLGVAGQGWFGDDINSAGATSNFSGTTTASSSTTGTVTIGNGTATTNVGIGGGAIVAGGVVTGVEGFTAGSSTLEGVLNLYDAGHTGHYLTLTCADTLSGGNASLGLETLGANVTLAVLANTHLNQNLTTTDSPTFAAETLTGKMTSYDGVTTAGIGVVPIVAAPRLTAQTAAESLTAYTTPAADTSYEVSANVNVTTYTSGTFTVTCTYTDETNTSRTATLNFSNVAGTLATACAAAGAFEGVPLHIRCKASTTITFASTGTFTSLTYNIEGTIAQLE